MRSTIIIISVAMVAGIIVGTYIGRQPTSGTVSGIQSPLPIRPTEPTAVSITKRSVFVPYWSTVEPADAESYERFIYFGVAVSTKGIVESEPGFLKMNEFLKSTEGLPVERWLTVRMTESNNNIDILNDTGSWNTIASETVELAKEKKFTGIVLDLEIAGLPSDGLVKRITEFVTSINQEVKKEQLGFAITIYGDVFYRKRPYDVQALSRVTDEIMVMAYDFHKSYGESGPNFPFEGRERYNYDFKMMVDDFLQVVPMNQLTVIYGMYGYDWIVDEKKRPVKPAQSVTMHQVREKFLDSCQWEHCTVQRDEKSQESEVNYIDEFNNYHIVWFEDEVSVDKKSEYMRKRGIGSIGYWAYGYF